MAETAVPGGQVNADSTGTTAAAPNGNVGNSESTGQTTSNGSDSGALESFFDPKSIDGKPELMAAYKQMQSSYTKKMQEYAKHRPKIEAYDRFESDPLGTLRDMAARYGYQFVQRGTDEPKDWNPQSWDDVMAKAEERVMQKMKPVFGELQNLKKQNIEGYMDQHFSDWRTYESDMLDNLKNHPSLVTDPDKLYRISVPSEVWEARATKMAMDKLKGTAANGQVSGGTTTKQQTTSEPTGKLSFTQAVEVARSRLQQQGIKRPAG